MLNEEIGHVLICERKEHVREVKDNFAVFAYRILMKVQSGSHSYKISNYIF